MAAKKQRKEDGAKMRKRLSMVLAACAMVSIVMSAGTKVHAERYEYDDLNRLIKVSYDDGSYAEYSYDGNGNLLEVIVHNANPRPSTSPAPSESGESQGESTESGENEGGEVSETPAPGANETQAPSSENESGEGTESQTGESQSEGSPNEGNPDEETEEKNIVEKVIDAIVEAFSKIIDWFKSWF